ncbi:hypothetical protein COT08_00630 [Candidatus Woesebacteria bacterium CG07_land_8_20_14_0_80_44_9]|uniref:Asl1-like glycosyl hydrolase catalytic domain-containing protein n=3 Tax=Candidatus Woeseibacteriota TaxID=1752722 RepID=A0A2M7APZ8_9BACT|nr:MAG: hypothetical protein COX04_01780 [Candidatus Woesebacteria bacterium CG22_combo_CG10-13_8_21_14_all_45_10]PIU28714.1 MAG: hypothetical protein COT08_00630 [Candidatus Woesebacteria bacterium CG07_land_8_20_14_0_80_44_9]PIU71708.1 MAG: hypothetical protein COS80_01805 [Candidatus Woesebacteria bacterium CG06_land_8_20_14_3_00_39_27]
MSVFKKLIWAGALFISALARPHQVQAIYNPLSVPNNSYGIHIVNTEDLDDAAKLVNSSGGDWGYITFIITKNDREISKWQGVFDKMRTLHLIPIVRVATAPNGENWEKPSFGEIDGWVSFLTSLNWVIKNRYLIIGNEVNLAKEWGGEVNPEEYATYLKTFSQKLKGVNPDFFVIPAGLDASLTTSKSSLDETVFLKRMLFKEPDIFEVIDGWASHSYPNPAFSGSPSARGRGTIATFAWELDLLRRLGVKKNLPVFISETGWNRETVKNLEVKFSYAFAFVWNDKQVVAITPFVLNYEFFPFANFSWKSGGNFGSLYTSVQALPKPKGAPLQEEAGQITRIFTPAIEFSGSSFTALLFVLNEGQSIWGLQNLAIKDLEGNNWEITKTSFTTLAPGESGLIFAKGLTPKIGGLYRQSLYLAKDQKPLTRSAEFKMFLFANLTWPPPLWHSDRWWKTHFPFGRT